MMVDGLDTKNTIFFEDPRTESLRDGLIAGLGYLGSAIGSLNG